MEIMRSKGNLRKRLLAAVCTALALAVVCAALVLAPDVSKAAEDEVAQIGGTKYATLDAAIAAAESGDTIELLGNAETSGINLHKDLTIQAADGLDTKPTITFVDYGIAMAYGDSTGYSLTFRDVDIVMTDIGSTPVTGEWNWQSICISKSTLTLDNVTMTMDGENAVGGWNSNTGAYKTVHAIYFTGSSELNLINGTVLTIKNYDEDALEWDSGNASYEVNITDSTYISDSNRSGFTGTFYATIDNSTVKVLNSAGNGSNNTYYTIKNNSYVEFDGSSEWGISAWRIDMTNSSTLVATNNGWSGVWARVLNVDSTCTLEVTDNGYSGSFTGVAASTSGASNAGISFFGNGTYKSTIEEGASVTIQNNAGPGIATLQIVANLTIGSATITNNGSYSAVYGGGIYNIGTVSLGADVELYNNHASTAGDDIYSNSTKTITFGTVGSKWVLDDCNHVIDGWYDDSESTQDDDGVSAGGRWEAHADASEANHIEEYTDFTDGLATVTGLVQLKAAHGADAQDKTSYPGMEKVIVTDDGDVDSDSAAAGGTVNFKLTTNVPDDLLNYIIPDVDSPKVSTLADVSLEERGTYVLTIHDVMDEALDLNSESIVVTLGDDDVLISPDQYTISYGVTHDDGTVCDFEITIDLINLYEMGAITDEDIANATPITVTYSATLSEDATAGAYKNVAWVDYPEGESEKDIVTVITYGIEIFKYDQADTSKGLEGAKFKLYQKDDEGNIIESTIVELISGSDGYVRVDGLDEGTYYLQETEAPEGYVCDDMELTIVIPEQASSSSYIVSASFANASIPSTGGTGTWMLTLGGLALVVAGVAVLAVRRVRSHRA